MSNSNSGRYLAYLISVIAILICYLSVRSFLGQPSLAVAAAAMGAIAGFLVTRTIQRRGQLSLAVTALGLPLLAAGCCVLVLQLTPLLNRQRAIASLRMAGVGFQAHPLDRSSEWLRNGSGDMLPVWIIDVVGKDCLSEINGIHSELGAFQSINYRELDRTKIKGVTLVQESSDSHFSRDLISWLNSCPKLEHLRIDLHHYSPIDGEALSELSDRIECRILILSSDTIGELSGLRKARWLQLIGQRFTQKHARLVCEAQGLNLLFLCFDEYSNEAIAALWPIDPQTRIRVNISIDPEEISEFAKLGLSSLDDGTQWKLLQRNDQ